MATAIKYPTSTNAVQKTLDAQLLAGVTTSMTLNSVTGIQNKAGVCVVDRVDANGTDTAAKREYIIFTGVSGNTLTGLTRNADGGGTDQDHAVGAKVEFISDVLQQQAIIDGLLQVVTAEGVLDTTKVQVPLSKATATENVAGTDDAKYLTALANVPAFNNSLARQAIINGNFDVDQRVGPYTSGRNNDDVYVLDHWNLISDGNDVFDVSQEAITDLPGSNYAIKLDVETAKRGGIVQFLESKDAQKFKGKYVSISFKVKSANISAIRAAVLSWGSTADSITSDVVGTWADTPTWAANWTAENTPADLTVTSDWTTVKIENIYIDSATVNNLALAIWLPNEETIGDIIYITQVQMNEGSVALPFMPKSYQEELRACQRYFSFNLPGTGKSTSTTRMSGTVATPVAMMKVPTATLFNGTNGAIDVGVAFRNVTAYVILEGATVYGGNITADLDTTTSGVIHTYLGGVWAWTAEL